MLKLSHRGRDRRAHAPAIVEHLERKAVPALAVVPFAPIVGVEFDGVVATLSKSDLPGGPSGATAQINWGPAGTTGTIREAGGGSDLLEVVGKFTYSAAGPFPVLVQVTKGGTTLSAFGTANVQHQPIALAPISATVTAGISAKDVAVGRFRVADPTAAPDQFTAFIRLNGSASSIPAKIAGITGSPGDFLVTIGEYAFAQAGTNQANVEVQWKAGGGGASALTTIQAVSPPMSLQGAPIALLAGASPVSRVVATLGDATPNAQAGNYRAEVDLGGGVIIPAVVQATGAGQFAIVAEIASAQPGSSSPVVRVTRLSDGSAAQAVAPLIVQPYVPGRLDPSTDTGAKGDGKTSSTNPLISGIAAPRSVIILSVQRAGQAGGRKQVRAVADPSGRWSVKLGPLGRGSYFIAQTTSAPTLDPVTQEIYRPGAPLVITAPQRFRRRP